MSRNCLLARCLVAVAVPSLLSGCANIRTGRIRRVDELPPSVLSDQKPSLVYRLDGYDRWASRGSDTFGSESHVSEGERKLASFETLRAELHQCLVESGYFSSIMHGGEEADVVIVARLSGDSKSVDFDELGVAGFLKFTGLALYSGASVTSGFFLPMWRTGTYTAECHVYAWDEPERLYRFEEGVAVAIWAPLVFISYNCRRAKVIPAVRKNLYRNALLRMHNEGVFIRNGSGESDELEE